MPVEKVRLRRRSFFTVYLLSYSSVPSANSRTTLSLLHRATLGSSVMRQPNGAGGDQIRIPYNVASIRFIMMSPPDSDSRPPDHTVKNARVRGSSFQSRQVSRADRKSVRVGKE